ncbi:hypothetical protein IAT38_000486 [Cryptococcus sp. DSM 104549]
MVQTLNFLVPSLHPNTLIDVSFPVPKLGMTSTSPTASEPLVHHMPVKYGEYQPLGGIKRMTSVGEDKIIVADDKFQVSTLELSPIETEAPAPPVVTYQESVKARSKDIWAGLIPVENGTISALTSGLLTFHPTSTSTPSSSRTVPSPLACLASTPLAPGQFALGGKEVDISIYDVERTFSSSTSAPAEGKRKKNALEPGCIWQAKNVPNNSLQLRPPVYHLAVSYLDSPDALVSGTKMGTVRRFDTRQRKPVADWKVAREGGVGCVVPGVEHELFFTDRSNLLASLDLRTGKVLYTYNAMTSTPHQLISPPPHPSTPATPASRRIGLASLSSDASLRIHSTTTPPPEGVKGNWGAEGKRGEVVGMLGGVGLGEGVWRGWGEREVEVAKEKKVDENGEEVEESEDEEEVWEGMDAVVDKGRDESEDEDESGDESEEEVPQTKKRSKRS